MPYYRKTRQQIITRCIIMNIKTLCMNFFFEVLWLNNSIDARAPMPPPISEKKSSICSGIRQIRFLANSLSNEKRMNVTRLIATINTVTGTSNSPGFIIGFSKSMLRISSCILFCGVYGSITCYSFVATATWLNLFEEVVALVINEDECGEVLNLNLPYSLHAQFWVFYTLNALDVVLCKNCCWATD